MAVTAAAIHRELPLPSIVIQYSLRWPCYTNSHTGHRDQLIAPAAAPEAAADDPAAPALPLEAPADDDEDCANDGIASDITNTSVNIIFKIRIKLTPTFS